MNFGVKQIVSDVSHVITPQPGDEMHLWIAGMGEQKQKLVAT